MVRTLHKDTDVRLIAYPGMGDWLPDAPRAHGGRALIAARDDGKRLGKISRSNNGPAMVFGYRAAKSMARGVNG